MVSAVLIVVGTMLLVFHLFSFEHRVALVGESYYYTREGRFGMAVGAGFFFCRVALVAGGEGQGEGRVDGIKKNPITPRPQPTSPILPDTDKAATFARGNLPPGHGMALRFQAEHGRFPTPAEWEEIRPRPYAEA